MEDKKGYIPVFRKFFDHPLWAEKREFSKAEAWIDMIQSARYSEDDTQEFIDGRLIEWGYGQFPASFRFLKKRWGWSGTGKVARFLELLKKQNMIKINTEQGQSVITLCNYCKYDIKKLESGTPTEHQAEHQRNTNGTQAGQNSKQDKQDKKGNKSSVTSLEDDVPKSSDREYWGSAIFIANHLLDSICRWDATHKYNQNPPSLKGWVTEIDKGLRLDGRDESQFTDFINFLFASNHKVANFWAPNIQSGKKLRDQFDVVKNQIKSEQQKQKTSNTNPNGNYKTKGDRAIEFFNRP